MASKGKEIRYWFEWAALASAYRLIPLIPHGILKSFAGSLGRLGFYVDGRGRRTAIENLRVAFPGRYTDNEIEDIALRCYQSFARTYLEQFWTRRLNPENITDYFHYEFDDRKAFEEAVEEGAVCMVPHYGNFEWGATGMASYGLTYTAIGQDFKNPRLTKLFKANREHFGHTIIPQHKAFLKLLRELRRGGHVGFLPDLTVPPSKAATVIRQFGLKASVTILGPVLVKRTGRAVLTGIPITLPGGEYYGRALKPIRFEESATEQEIAQACWDAVEPFIERWPEHWLWMYKHWKFRPAEDGDRYPDYANRSAKYDKLEARVFGEEEKSSS